MYLSHRDATITFKAAAQISRQGLNVVLLSLYIVGFRWQHYRFLHFKYSAKIPHFTVLPHRRRLRRLSRDCWGLRTAPAAVAAAQWPPRSQHCCPWLPPAVCMAPQWRSHCRMWSFPPPPLWMAWGVSAALDLPVPCPSQPPPRCAHWDQRRNWPWHLVRWRQQRRRRPVSAPPLSVLQAAGASGR